MCNQPNIFKFATSELSQDAFICWLVSHVNYLEDMKLNKCAKDFVALLHNIRHKDTPITGDDVKEIKELKQQYFHTDVYFQAIINISNKDYVISFIIEDKMYTSHHSDQLKKYKNQINGDNIEEDEIIGIYFKTGYIYPEDEEAKTKYDYEILDYEKLHDFLKKYQIDNLIFDSYKKYSKEKFYIPYKTWPKKLMEENKMTVEWEGEEKYLLSFPSVQWEFMKEVKKYCPGCIYSKEINLEDIPSIGRGSNRNGPPWTQMWFVKLKDFYGKDVNETLFYRLDKKGKDDYYLSLRQYAKIDDNKKEQKKRRLKQFRDHFENAHSSSSLSFGQVGNRGDFESEVAILFFKDNGPMQILSNLGSVHNNFIERLKTSELVPLSEL